MIPLEYLVFKRCKLKIGYFVTWLLEQFFFECYWSSGQEFISIKIGFKNAKTSNHASLLNSFEAVHPLVGPLRLPIA